ncbi:MAG TPA: protein kinase [Chitinophagaceae bacterium]|nr:protein kinase [Chitinophagaceae bacterium]
MSGIDSLVEGVNNLNVYKKGQIKNPHKYLLLLSVITLIEKTPNHRNEFSFEELEPVFLQHFDYYFPNIPKYRKMLEYPFVHLQNEGFWFLKVKKGKEEEYQTIRNMRLRLTRKRIQEVIEFAYFSNDSFNQILSEGKRSKLKVTIEEWLENSNKSNIFNPNSNVIKENSSLFSHEQSAIDQINILLNRQNNGKLVSNILLFDPQSNNFLEYDLIVVTCTGIFVVELKHWSGTIKINSTKDPYNWVIDENRYRRNPHRLNGFKCKVLKGVYQHRFKTYPNIRVESVVVLTHPEAIAEGASDPLLFAEKAIYNPTFSSIKDFITYLKRHSAFQKNVIDKNQIDSIIRYLYSLNQPKASLTYSIPGFETIEYLRQTSDVIELIARPLVGNSRKLNRFRIFRPPHQLAKVEIERFRKRAFNTFNAVTLLNDHPNVGKVWLVPNEEGDIIEGSDWSEVGTLRDIINEYRRSNKYPVKNAASIYQGVFNGLRRAHEENVIHRALKPENILIMNGIPKIINFDLSYQYHEDERQHLTVIADPSKLKDDGYTAPEVLTGKDIDETTDYFSLGVITYELLTGVKPFANTIEMQAKGGKLTEEHIKRLYRIGMPKELISCLKQMVVFDREKRIKSIQEIEKAFIAKSASEEKAVLNAKLPPGAEYDVYKIIKLIGEGTDTQIYKARTLNSKLVALKIFNREVPCERVTKENEVLEAITSSYVVKSGRIGHWDKDRYFIEMDYIDGEPLRAWINRSERPDWTTFQTITQCLIEAIKAFHNHRDEDGNPEPLLHSDIKPDNILITKDHKAVLIDCGIAGAPRGDIFQGTVGYVPPDYIAGADMAYSQDGDLFALGVTLWEWLFGEKPYKNPAIGDEPSVLQLHDNNYPPYLMKWLTKAVATLKGIRFDNIEEMESAFHGKLDLDIDSSESQAISSDEDISSQDQQHDIHNMQGSKIENVAKNGFVKYLNSLTSVSAGNENAIAEAQIGNKYFERIYVENPITDFVYKELKENRRNVILTGNAGDGKTTIAAEICRRITGGFEIVPSELKKAGFVIIKDMSELTEEERVHILEQGITNNELSFLIISNTGTLLDSASKLNVNGIEVGTIRSQLLEKMESSQPELFLNNRFSIINIGRTDSISTACRILKKMVDCEDWTFCRKCNKDCPIRINIELIKENEEIVLERIELLYRRLYEYGIRLTLRQMTGHLAYAITSGKICCEIQDLPRVALEENLPKMLFINRLFGDDGITVQSEALQLDPVRQIRKLRFGTELEPNFEREIWVKKESPLPIRGQTASEVFNTLMNSLNESGKYGRLQIRRLVYFLGSTEKAAAKQFISVFLDSPFLQNYLEVCRSKESIIPNNYEYEYRRRILQVLQEYFTGIRLTNNDWGGRLYITLNRRGSGARTQMVVADFLFDDFNLQLRTKTSFTGEKVGDFYLVCGDKVEMKLDLPFFDYVIKRQQGDVTGELSPYYADRLERFKVDLMTYYANTRYSQVQNLRLLKIGADRNFQVIDISFSKNGGLVVLG